MIAVVTGGSGFIGRNLVERLTREGHDVRCLARPRGGLPPEAATRFEVSLADPRALRRCPAFEGADAVFHLAGATRAVRASDFRAANVDTTRNLLSAIVDRGLRPRFVLVSSQAAAGPAVLPEAPVRETDAARPVEPYGVSKLEAERIAEGMANRIPITVIRPCSVFGPWDRDFLRLFRMAQSGLIVYPGVMRHWLSLIHVDDVVTGLVQAARLDAAIGKTYFVAAEPPVAWRTFGEWIATAAGRDVRHVDLPPMVVRAAGVLGEWFGRLTGTAPIANRSKTMLARAPHWVCSGSLARMELALPAPRSLPEAVADTYLWYRERGWLHGSRGAAAQRA